MKKGIIKILMITIIVLVGIYTFLPVFNRGTPKEITLSLNSPEKELIKEVFSYPTGSYRGQKERITISANGDIMFHGTQITSAYKNSKYNFHENFTLVKKYIEGADLALANFETTTAGGTPSGYPVFNAPDETLTTLKDVGYDILSTANNHSLDKGKKGILRTIEKVKENSMVNIGTYAEAGENIHIEEVKGIKLSVLAYTYGLNGLDSLLTDSERRYMVNLIREDQIKEDIQRSQELGADFTVVMIHWGNEYELTPSNYQKELASKMFGWGADIILGGHPHVIQKSEMVNVDGEMKYIIYSMGNFISNQRRETLGTIANRNYTEDGVMVRLTLEKDFIKNESKIVGVNYVPTWVNRSGSSGRYLYEVLPIKDALTMNEYKDIKSKLNQAYENTMGKMTLYRDLGE